MLSDKATQLLDSGNYVAASLTPEEDLKRWLVIFPFKVNPETGMTTLNAPSEPWKYRIRCIGIPQDFDYDTYDLHDEYITSFEDAVVESMGEVEAIVERWIENPDVLEDPRKCDCPI